LSKSNTGEVEIFLNEAKDWSRWYQAFERQVELHKLVLYVSLDAKQELEEPTLPTAEDELDQINARMKEDYEQSLIAYQQHPEANPRPSLPVLITSLDPDQRATLLLQTEQFKSSLLNITPVKHSTLHS
jgi:hypothetical protein